MLLKFWSTWLDSNQRLEGFADLWLNHSPTCAFLRKTFVIPFNKLRIELKFCCKFSFCGDGRSRTFAFGFSVQRAINHVDNHLRYIPNISNNLSGRLDSNQHLPRSRRGRFKPISVLPVFCDPDGTQTHITLLKRQVHHSILPRGHNHILFNFSFCWILISSVNTVLLLPICHLPHLLHL